MKRRSLALLVLSSLLALLWAAPGAHAAFGIAPGSLNAVAEEEDGLPDLRAGSHPFAYSLHFDLNTDSQGNTEGGQMRDLLIEAPSGLVGNPRAVPACSRQTLEGGKEGCSNSTQVGVLVAIVAKLGQIVTPIYNITPPTGAAVEFGVNAKTQEFLVQQFGSVRTENPQGESEYGVNVFAPNLPVQVTSVTATIWGMPADPGHTPERGPDSKGGGFPSEAPLLPFLTLPASCLAPPSITVAVDSVLNPGAYVRETAPMKDAAGNPLTLAGCSSVPFNPAATATPSTEQADSSSGLAFELSLPNEGLLTPGGVAETQPEKTEVIFPQGIAANPSAAGGLVGCTEAQYDAADGEPGTGCPQASKIGTLVAKSPVLEEAIEGSVYLAQPHENKFGSLLALYIVATAKERGILVKQAGQVHADPITGQLTTVFDELPPLPYSSFEVALREGPRAPLITPQACGEYRTVAKLYPFSAPEAPVERKVPFKITSGAHGSSCVSSEAAMPNHPTLEAGSTSTIAGAYSPFVFRASRADGEQRFASISATLPPGLIGRIAGVPYCSESGIATAASRIQEGGGAQELASPSCPAASQVGTVSVGAGAGPSPYYAQGKAYLAGPYKGAPLSLEVIAPAVAGPFDLGSVAVRTALYVNESSAQIHAVSDPLPTILHGIPLDVRTISLQMDRPEFTLNPTNCQAKSVLGTTSSLSGSIASLSAHFAVGGCRGLNFKPDLKLFFTGQMKRTGFPAVKAVLTQPKGQNANVSGATVILPKGMLIANAHINSPCTRVQFNSGSVPGEGCPAKSVLGTAKVWTPLLGQPEEGKVFFRSNGGERELPDLAVALRGQIPLQLVGFIDSVGRKGVEVRRIRSRFLKLPDAPVSRFELKLSGGKKGLLQNSKNLCKTSDKAKFQLIGQNGAAHDTEPKVQVACGKGGKQKGKQR
jgi:hypothetical protein